MTEPRPIFPVVFAGKSSEGSTLDTSAPVDPTKPDALTRSIDGSNVRDFRPIPGERGPEAPKASPVPASAEPSPDADSTSNPVSSDSPVIVEKENPQQSGSDDGSQPGTQPPTSGNSSLPVGTFAPKGGEILTSSFLEL